MPSLTFGEGIVAVSCRSKLRIFSYSNGSEVTQFSENLSLILIGDNERQTKEDHKDQNIPHQKLVDPNQTPPDGEIICSSLSTDGEYFACCDDRKFIYLWKTKPWHFLSKRVIQKRCTAVTFTSSSEFLLLADKFGDIYQFSVKNTDEDGVLLLGHVSMLLDLAATPDDQFVISCDRDEKIRVSCLPNAYNIHGYCLGHTQFVSCLQIIPGKENLLISAGGDSSLKLWDYRNCRLLTSTLIDFESKIRKHGEYFTVTQLTCSTEGCIAISLLGEKVCMIYKLLEDSLGCTLKEVAKVNLSAEVLCMNYDPKDCLWVIQRSSTKTVQVFQFCEVNGEYQVISSLSLPEVWQNSVLHSLNQESDLFKDPLKGEHPLGSLHKKSFDNLKEYMDRKQQRIEEEDVRKQNHEARLARQAQRKRMKVDVTDDSKEQP